MQACLGPSPSCSPSHRVSSNFDGQIPFRISFVSIYFDNWGQDQIPNLPSDSLPLRSPRASLPPLLSFRLLSPRDRGQSLRPKLPGTGQGEVRLVWLSLRNLDSKCRSSFCVRTAPYAMRVTCNDDGLAGLTLAGEQVVTRLVWAVQGEDCDGRELRYFLRVDRCCCCCCYCCCCCRCHLLFGLKSAQTTSRAVRAWDPREALLARIHQITA